MTKRWINTRHGIKFTPLDPVAEDVHLVDIAFALSNLCRYAGHVDFYSVAEHSVITSLIVRALGGTLEEQRAALLHDATEAYLVDLPSPIKRAPEMAPYREAEARLSVVIATRFGLPSLEPDIVKSVDAQMIALEANILHENRHVDWVMPCEPDPRAQREFDFYRDTAETLALSLHVSTSKRGLGFAPAQAREMFLRHYAVLFV